MKQRKLTRKEIKSIKEPEAIEIIKTEIDGEMIFKNLPLNLDLAGIFYVSAFIQIKNGNRDYKKLLKEISAYEKAYMLRAKKYSINSDEFITHLSSKIRNIEILYEPVVRHFSTAKILLVCCAESFVNEIANVCINGRKLEEFDRLSIFGKWLFIQDLLKIKKINKPDSNPLQGFGSLIKERNKLVHFKGMKRSLKTFEIPNYINELKLTPKDCSVNFESVKNLIRTFSLSWRDSNGPDWLNVEKSNFRNPCFYLGNRDVPIVLYSDEYDKGRHL